MVGGANANSIDVLAGQQLAEILVALAVLVVITGVDLVHGFLEVALVHIADGHHLAIILEAEEGVEIAAALPADPNAADGDFFRGGTLPEQAARQDQWARRGGGQKFQHIAAVGIGWGIHGVGWRLGDGWSLGPHFCDGMENGWRDLTGQVIIPVFAVCEVAGESAVGKRRDRPSRAAGVISATISAPLCRGHHRPGNRSRHCRIRGDRGPGWANPRACGQKRRFRCTPRCL